MYGDGEIRNVESQVGRSLLPNKDPFRFIRSVWGIDVHGDTSSPFVIVHFLTTWLVTGPFGVSVVVTSVTRIPLPSGIQLAVRLPFGGV